MKRLLLLLLLTGLSVTTARAQTTDIEQLTQTEEFENGFVLISDELTGLFTNNTFISGLQQLAVDANQAAQINVEGNDNTTSITQAGTGITGGINILGSGNETRLNQRGTNLLSVLEIEGDFNVLDVDQRGSNLQNLVDVTGSGINFNVDQDNSGILFSQSGGTSVPLIIQQSGETVPIIITNN